MFHFTYESFLVFDTMQIHINKQWTIKIKYVLVQFNFSGDIHGAI